MLSQEFGALVVLCVPSLQDSHANDANDSERQAGASFVLICLADFSLG